MAKRMKLISEVDFNRLSQYRNLPKNNAESSLGKKSQDASCLLQAHNIPDDIKLAMYSGLMNSIGDHLKKILETPVLVKNVNDAEKVQIDKTSLNETAETENHSSSAASTGESTESAVQLTSIDHHFLNILPEKCRRKAGDIMLCLKEHPELIQWNKTGEVSYFERNFETGTSIVDLLAYAVHDLKWTIAPKGANRFLLCVKQLNIPLSLLTGDVRKMLSKDLDNIVDVKSAGDSPKSFMQMKSRLKQWIALKEETVDEFQPVASSTPRQKHS